MKQQTLSIIKPDGVSKELIGEIYQIFKQHNLTIIQAKMLTLTKQQAENFYQEHKDQAFFPALIEFMTSGRIMVQILEGEEAISKYRKVMGSTNPSQAEKGTIRQLYANSMQQNIVHGSDSIQTAQTEIKFFF